MDGKKKSDNDLLYEISSKLSEIAALLAINGKERDDQIKYVGALGFTNAEVARITGIPKGTVDMVRAKVSDKKKEKKNGAG